MTDANSGGWPDASKPGVPMSPEQDGWHWVSPLEGRLLVALFWRPQMWVAGSIELPAEILTAAFYLGPCLTPAEVTALVEAARREEREACAMVADTARLPLREVTGGPMAGLQTFSHEWPVVIAAAIRARGGA